MIKYITKTHKRYGYILYPTFGTIYFFYFDCFIFIKKFNAGIQWKMVSTSFCYCPLARDK